MQEDCTTKNQELERTREDAAVSVLDGGPGVSIPGLLPCLRHSGPCQGLQEPPKTPPRAAQTSGVAGAEPLPSLVDRRHNSTDQASITLGQSATKWAEMPDLCRLSTGFPRGDAGLKTFNSENGHSLTRYPDIPSQKAPKARESCPDAGSMRGRCEHGTTRWLKLSCKRRGCPVCGETRRRLISWRIQQGLEILAGVKGGAWFVGTWDHDVSKVSARRTVARFIRWLRKRLGHFEYASTWERTKRGWLHVNVIIAPWSFVPQATLSWAWQRFGGGPRVWVERVQGSIGFEVAKVSQRQIANYVAKWDQQVQTGRGVTYSRGWPKLPDLPAKVERQGVIHWEWFGHFSPEDMVLRSEVARGYWREVGPLELKFAYGEECLCFEPEEPERIRTPGRSVLDFGGPDQVFVPVPDERGNSP